MTKRFIWDNRTIAIRDKQERKHYYVDVTCIDEVVDLLNDLSEENTKLKSENEELKQNNDIKFWKHQFMEQFNKTSLILSELGRAYRQGYEFSDMFKEYTKELEKKNKENINDKLSRLQNLTNYDDSDEFECEVRY